MCYVVLCTTLILPSIEADIVRRSRVDLIHTCAAATWACLLVNTIVHMITAIIYAGASIYKLSECETPRDMAVYTALATLAGHVLSLMVANFQASIWAAVTYYNLSSDCVDYIRLTHPAVWHAIHAETIGIFATAGLVVLAIVSCCITCCVMESVENKITNVQAPVQDMSPV
jgi:flagellar biosynthesis protein FliQ